MEIVGVIIAICVGGWCGYMVGSRVGARTIRLERKDAIAASKRVMTGQISEQLAPLLEGFHYNYKDALFVGKGVDYIVFDGLTEGDVREVVLVEIKTGSARQSQREKRIQQAINDGRCRYEIVRL